MTPVWFEIGLMALFFASLLKPAFWRYTSGVKYFNR